MCAYIDYDLKVVIGVRCWQNFVPGAIFPGVRYGVNPTISIESKTATSGRFRTDDAFRRTSVSAGLAVQHLR